MKKFGMLSIFFLALVSFSTSVSAHAVREDGPILGRLHIDPDDDPVVGYASKLHFQILDYTTQVDLNDCECVVVVTKDKQTLLKAPLVPSNDAAVPIDENYVVDFTFPSKGQYFVEVLGNPKPESGYKPFKLVYDFQVERTVAPTSLVTEILLPTVTPLIHERVATVEREATIQEILVMNKFIVVAVTIIVIGSTIFFFKRKK